ncbi:MAG: ATP-binding cassette domain-containing protein [Eubacteriales bacterium]|nr:ATP-binding cassette domain-containing protein [Eubacteriales bacterium]
MIRVQEATKIYRVPVPSEGRFAGIRNLFHMNYTDRTVVDHISFDIRDGESVCYIGPNGAGKSTTVKMLSGILMPTSGSVSVNGLDPCRNRKENARNIGVVFGQKTSLWWDVPVIDSYRLLKEMYGISDAAFRKNLELFCDLLEMESFLNSPVRQLSLGQRMRADLAAALLHDPEILFLDEPTIGVDIVAKARIREFISELNSTRGITVMVTTHDMADMEKIVDRVIVIDKGKIYYDGTVAAMKAKYGKKRRIDLTFTEEDPEISIPGLTEISSSPFSRSFSFHTDELTAEQTIAKLTALPLHITDISVQQTDIEEIVRDIYLQSGRTEK